MEKSVLRVRGEDLQLFEHLECVSVLGLRFVGKFWRKLPLQLKGLDQVDFLELFGGDEFQDVLLDDRLLLLHAVHIEYLVFELDHSLLLRSQCLQNSEVLLLHSVDVYAVVNRLLHQLVLVFEFDDLGEVLKVHRLPLYSPVVLP